MDLTNVPEHTKAGLLVMNANTPLAKVDKASLAKECIQRYLDGTDLTVVANEYNVTRPRLYQILAEHAETEWKSAQAAFALHQYEEAEKDMKIAPDGLTLARAREQVKSAQWKLERVLRRIYGQDAPQVNIQVNLGDIGERIRTLEAELRVLPTEQAE